VRQGLALELELCRLLALPRRLPGQGENFYSPAREHGRSAPIRQGALAAQKDQALGVNLNDER
jgi:hypothetical protein